MHADGRGAAQRAASKSFCLVLMLCAGAAAGCGGDPADLAPVKLRHEPALARMSAEQLRALSLDCEKYPTKDSMRGRYDAKYCEDAIAAWGDAPLQMIILPNAEPISNTSR